MHLRKFNENYKFHGCESYMYDHFRHQVIEFFYLKPYPDYFRHRQGLEIRVWNASFCAIKSFTKYVIQRIYKLRLNGYIWLSSNALHSCVPKVIYLDKLSFVVYLPAKV